MRLKEVVNVHASPVALPKKIERRAKGRDAARKLVRKSKRIFFSGRLARDGKDNRKQVFRAMPDFTREEPVPVLVEPALGYIETETDVAARSWPDIRLRGSGEGKPMLARIG